jgi:hypothetical protein
MFMSWAAEPSDLAERKMRRQVLAFLDDYCRGMTLRDAREWYVDAFADAPPFGETAQS